MNWRCWLAVEEEILALSPTLLFFSEVFIYSEPLDASCDTQNDDS
jgi:hypothetical protein